MVSYKQAGVDIAAGDQLIDLIRLDVERTKIPGVLGSIGGFGAVFDLRALDMRDPLLVSTTDGVGTKLLLAKAADRWDTIGQDLVAMCVNDLLAQGARPLFFLDYLATGQLELNQARLVIQSIARACGMAGCALVGGETAEMPGMYKPGDVDLAGFAVGAVERDHLLPRTVEPGDVLLGLPSSGAHSNGYSLMRRLIEGMDLLGPAPWDKNQCLIDCLLEPTKIYTRAVQPLIHEGLLRGLAHITGGGIPGNLRRVLPSGVRAQVALPWPLSPLWDWVGHQGVGRLDMLSTFNLGIGMILVVPRLHVDQVKQQLDNMGEAFVWLGHTTSHAGPASVDVVWQHYG